MSMRKAPRPFHQPLTPSHMADVRRAASTMTGATRRAFEAEMALQYGESNALQADTICGWSRRTVALGLAERRTGRMCLGAQAAWSGRKRWEDTHPEAAADLRRLAEAQAPQDPTVRTTLASTRLTANAAVEALRAQGYGEAQVPAPSTMAEGLNRLGFRLRTVVKATPQKQSDETAAIVANIAKKPTRQ